ncbi:ABC transporter permease [Nocardioides plantarum]|uniref:ABC transporter permease n=1 Tax=Nocardioides plantarum TaxID=29299 RepID=A0ABV5KDA8_9ACTN|nr:ABC transporter permease [Nocardioides plantarum]
MRNLWRTIWNTKGVGRWALLIGLVITAVFVAFALFAPWIAPYDFAQNRVDGVKLPKVAHPGGDYLFGTNGEFYDVFSRVVWGSRTALEVIVLSVLFAGVLGVPLGLVSGFVGGRVDKLLVFLMDALYSFPSLLLAIVFAFLLKEQVGGGVISAALSLTAIYIPQYFRVVRNTTVSAREATYVEAARAIGAGPFTIMRKYLFANVVQSVPVIATLNAADALGTLAALGFLGLGIQPTEAAEWGYDIQVGLSYAQGGVWWPSFFPAMAIILLITALTFVGEGLNETVNPALRRRRHQPVVFPARDADGAAARPDAGADPTLEKKEPTS